MFKCFKSLSLAIALCAGMGAAPAHATLFKLSTRGVIDGGFDVSGLFGAAGDLTGRSFLMTTEFDTKDNDYFYSDAGMSESSDSGAVSPGNTHVSVTVDGKTLSTTLTSLFTNSAHVYHTPPGPSDGVDSVSDGTDNANQEYTFDQHVYTLLAGLTASSSMSQAIPWTAWSPDWDSHAEFSTDGPLGQAFFDATPAAFSLIADVPEPAGPALFAAGLLSIAVWRKRRGGSGSRSARTAP